MNHLYFILQCFAQPKSSIIDTLQYNLFWIAFKSFPMGNIRYGEKDMQEHSTHRFLRRFASSGAVSPVTATTISHLKSLLECSPVKHIVAPSLLVHSELQALRCLRVRDAESHMLFLNYCFEYEGTRGIQNSQVILRMLNECNLI